MRATPADARAMVAAQPAWYHTMEVAPGVVTPGHFDLRRAVSDLPWPDVRGKRCLDVGTYDGFLAFELERRGAAEVVATDLGDHDELDWPADARAHGARAADERAGPPGAGFRLAKELLGSAVERVEVSAYELSPERVGRFDVVVCGALMLHLRDPIAALEAIRGVCEGWFLSAEQIRLGLTLRHRRTALAELSGSGERCQWWVPNTAGHRRMLFAAGFEPVRWTRPYAVAYGPAHPPRGRSAAVLRRSAVRRAVLGADGVPYAAVLARTRL
jgi:tRNA (mo5U34)-methyltransferase